jgi:streptogramin lyase
MVPVVADGLLEREQESGPRGTGGSLTPASLMRGRVFANQRRGAGIGRRLALAVAVVAAAVVLVNCAAAFAALPAGQIETYPVPNAGSGEPTGITAGSDGSLWFTMHGGTGQLDRITTSGSFTEFPTATADPGPITAGPSGDTNLWFGDEGDDKIGKSTTAGSITEFTVPPVTDQAPEPTAITAGPGNALWFIEADGGSDTIDEIPTAATVATPGIQHFTVPTAGAYATGIASGPDGNLWFTEQGADQIGKLTPGGTFSSYPLPDLDSYPAAITAGPNGALWFTESYEIGEIPTTATVATPGIQQFTLLDGDDPTDSIAVGPDGNLWFPVSTGSFSESIARMTPTGTVTYYPLSTPAGTDPDVSSITAGPDGNMWFTEEGVDTIGEIGTSASGTAAGISLAPSGGLAVGNSTLGVRSGPQTVTVTNTGDAPLMLGTVQIQAAASTPFGITALARGDAHRAGADELVRRVRSDGQRAGLEPDRGGARGRGADGALPRDRRAACRVGLRGPAMRQPHHARAGAATEWVPAGSAGGGPVRSRHAGNRRRAPGRGLRHLRRGGARARRRRARR